MNAAGARSPNCDPEVVERAVFEEAIELHPVRLTVAELSLWIAANPEDNREVEAITQAIHDLRRFGLVRYRNDDLVVEPTQAAFRAHALLIGT